MSGISDAFSGISGQTAFSAGSSIANAVGALSNSGRTTVNPIVPGLITYPPVQPYPQMNVADLFAPPQIQNANTFLPIDIQSLGVQQSIEQSQTETQAQSQEQQGWEAMTEAGLAGQQKVNDVNEAMGNQAHAYNSSGVLLEGSPLLVLQQTRAMGSQEIQAIQQQGLAQNQLAIAQAAITRDQGRAQLIGQDSQLSQALQSQSVQIAQQATTTAQQNIQQISQMHSQSTNVATAQLQNISNLAKYNLAALSSGQRFTAQPIQSPLAGTNLAGALSQLGNLFGNGRGVASGSNYIPPSNSLSTMHGTMPIGADDPDLSLTDFSAAADWTGMSSQWGGVDF